MAAAKPTGPAPMTISGLRWGGVDIKSAGDL
jgi:hypothetical protein